VIDTSRLLADLQRLLRKLEADLRQRCQGNQEVDSRARAEYDKARNAGRISQAYEVWREEFITQAAVAWILGCVFVRFIEDNRLLDTQQEQIVWLAGLGVRSQLARDRHTLYFREHPKESDREYLEHVFREIAKYPGTRELFNERHNPLWSLGVSGDGATELLNFWQQLDPATGMLQHDFTDAEWKTRFLGDLYQDLSEAARKKYALLQTPVFVEEFILDRTLTPAINEFGYQTVRLIDPACGSGHFLLGAFARLVDLWVRNEPGANSRALAQRALNGVYGVDLNPFAVAIARFRLLIAALRVSEVNRLRDAPAFEINLAVGDSLLHGPPRGNGAGDQLHMSWSPMAHVYESEDKEQLDRILVPGRYHAVVGNPPYITVKDGALSNAYRTRFGSCFRKYSLVVPFMERFFDLSLRGSTNISAGFLGMIISNAFMKRTYGERLIDRYIPHWDLSHVIDTSGAYIPNHGNPNGIPTAIIFARNREPVLEVIRAVMGIRSEPEPPLDPAHGLVWSSILAQIDLPGAADDFISVNDTPRETFHKHPWSIGGGGVSELRDLIEEQSTSRLKSVVLSIGPGAILGEEEAFDATHLRVRRPLPNGMRRIIVEGEHIRDWSLSSSGTVLFPYTCDIELRSDDVIKEWLWPLRTTLWGRADFGGQTYRECGRPFWEYHQIPKERNRTALSIAGAFLATHNHFVFDRGAKVFKQTAPVIKLIAANDENEHLGLLGLLNSSTACFWGRQTFFPRGGFSSGKWEERLEWDATKLMQFPIPQNKPLELARKIDQLAQELQTLLPIFLASCTTPNVPMWEQSKRVAEETLAQMVALQEELDWECYGYYGLVDQRLALLSSEMPRVKLGERAFEIVMARKIAAGNLQTTWFERHGSTATTEIPSHWSQDYRRVVERRIKVIETDANIRLIEQPEYKRRWHTEPWNAQAERALRDWLLNRLEGARYWTSEVLTTTARLADQVRGDAEFMQVAEMYRGRSDFDLANLVAELVRSEAVPFLPVLRYKPSGLRHRVVWERVWELQRKEDEIDARLVGRQSVVASSQTGSKVDNRSLTLEKVQRIKIAEVDDIPVPPKYKSADFLEQTFWRLRGKLDAPRERFVSYPYCERDADQSLPIAWAGWDHLQQAKALANYYESVKATEGWGPARMVPLLAGILELLPWLMQWHNELDPAYGIGMGEFFKGFVEEEVRAMGLTLNQVRDWTPAV
jgi:hypothetical protein